MLCCFMQGFDTGPAQMRAFAIACSHLLRDQRGIHLDMKLQTVLCPAKTHGL